ncbi:hypothetical protein FXO38_08763 [Capsicum annuum]|nr:hypothetical protein FXO38_08763 [Capsicum annuum]
MPPPLVPLSQSFEEDVGVGAHDMDYVEAKKNYGIKEENEVDAVDLDEDDENIGDQDVGGPTQTRMDPATDQVIKKYAKNERFCDVVDVYEVMPEKNVVSYNAVLSGYLGIGDFMSARKMFDEMVTLADLVTLAMKMGYSEDVVEGTAILNAFTRVGNFDRALRRLELTAGDRKLYFVGHAKLDDDGDLFYPLEIKFYDIPKRKWMDNIPKFKAPMLYSLVFFIDHRLYVFSCDDPCGGQPHFDMLNMNHLSKGWVQDAPLLRTGTYEDVVYGIVTNEQLRILQSSKWRSTATEREQAHIDKNIVRKLNPEEHREKKERKLFDDPNIAPETIVSVYKMNDLSHPQTRFKFNVNSQENYLTSCTVISEGISVIVVEGGKKSIKQYGKLILRRIDWVAAGKKEDDESYGGGFGLTLGSESHEINTNNDSDDEEQEKPNLWTAMGDMNAYIDKLYNHYVDLLDLSVPTNITPTVAPHPPEEPSSSKRPTYSGFHDYFYDLNY